MLSKTFFFGLLFLSSYFSYSQDKVFEREYTYQASELDSKNSSKIIASNLLRQEILDEVGVYLASETKLITSEVNGVLAQDFKENIDIITSGIVKFQVLDESWDGKTYWIKARIIIDEASIQSALDALVYDRNRMTELSQIRQDLNKANEEIEALRLKAIDRSQSPRETDQMRANYQVGVENISKNNIQLDGNVQILSGDHHSAINSFSDLIATDPGNISAYVNRGVSKAYLKDFNGALLDLNSAISIDPYYIVARFNRGKLYMDMGQYNKALKEFNFTSKADLYLFESIFNRGVCKSKLKDYRGAISDYKYAIRLRSNDSEVYFNKALAHFYLAEIDIGCDDIHTSISLGNQKAKKYLDLKCN
jgi:tetratricopeptide (TPR) repeat protein